MERKHQSISRREFLRKAAAGTAAGVTFLKPAWAQQPEVLTAGLIGCGGRGTSAGEQFMQCAPNCKIAALADVFQDRLEGARKRYALNGIEIPDDHCFTGFDCYKGLLETDIDVVLMAAPPHFRPAHFKAAIEAGKHVFMEPPVAVDPVGARSIMETAKLADQKGLCVVAGTQRRHHAGYVETQKRVGDGMIGRIIWMRCSWCQGTLWSVRRENQMSQMEYQLRNWPHYVWLSGDHIVEQHVHNIDVCNWFGGAPPESAMGFGSRVQKELGNTYDFFCVEFTYSGGVRCSSLCRQISDCHNEVSEHVWGEKGHTDCRGNIMAYDGSVIWRYEGPEPTDPYIRELTDLVEAIRTGNRINEAENVALSTLTAIMGRTSAYTGRRMTWEEIMKSDMRLGPEKYELGDYEAEPVQKPGKPWR